MQLYDLGEMAKQRGFEIVQEYSDVISRAKSKRPGLDALMADARRRKFDVVLVAAFDRVARSVRHTHGLISKSRLRQTGSNGAFTNTSLLGSPRC
jgi:DNA invertase Pin-like site-specific DNA recombinase